MMMMMMLMMMMVMMIMMTVMVVWWWWWWLMTIDDDDDNDDDYDDDDHHHRYYHHYHHQLHKISMFRAHINDRSLREITLLATTSTMGPVRARLTLSLSYRPLCLNTRDNANCYDDLVSTAVCVVWYGWTCALLMYTFTHSTQSDASTGIFQKIHR